MRSREMHLLVRSAKEIRVALDTDGDRVGDLLNERYPVPVGEGEPAFDYRKHIQNLNTQLADSVDGAISAEDEHSKQRIRVSRSKSDRDSIVKQGRDHLVAVRGGLESIYERGAFELAYLSGTTPRVPDQVLEQLDQTVKLLRQPAVDLRQVQADGFDVNLEAVALGLEARKADLLGSIGTLDSVRKVAEGTYLVKEEAIDVLRRTIVWVGRTAEGLFVLAGEDELAKRIRRSARRPPRPSEEEEAEPAPTDETGAEESAPEPQAPLTSTES